MGKLFLSVSKIILFILNSLKPLFIIFFIIGTITGILFGYEQYRLLKERGLGASLAQNLDIGASCNQIVNAGDKVNLKFTFTNKNNQPLVLEKIGIDANLLGSANKITTKLITTKPASTKSEAGGQFLYYQFKGTVEIRANKKQEIILTLLAASREAAGAKAHTIVIYKGLVTFSLSHEITTQAPCELQIRYAS